MHTICQLAQFAKCTARFRYMKARFANFWPKLDCDLNSNNPISNPSQIMQRITINGADWQIVHRMVVICSHLFIWVGHHWHWMFTQKCLCMRLGRLFLDTSVSYPGCLTILEIYWDNFSLLEILEIYWKLAKSLEIIWLILGLSIPGKCPLTELLLG